MDRGNETFRKRRPALFGLNGLCVKKIRAAADRDKRSCNETMMRPTEGGTKEGAPASVDPEKRSVRAR
jgi:hypothetical protein